MDGLALPQRLPDHDKWLAQESTLILAAADIDAASTPFETRTMAKLGTYRLFTEPPDLADFWTKRKLPVPDGAAIPIRNRLVEQMNQPELTRPRDDLDKLDQSLTAERHAIDEAGFEAVTYRFTIVLFAVELFQRYALGEQRHIRLAWDTIVPLALPKGLSHYHGTFWSASPDRSNQLPKPNVQGTDKLCSLLELQISTLQKQLSNVHNPGAKTTMQDIIARSLRHATHLKAEEVVNKRRMPTTDRQSVVAPSSSYVSMVPSSKSPEISSVRSLRISGSNLLQSAAGLVKRMKQTRRLEPVNTSRSTDDYNRTHERIAKMTQAKIHATTFLVSLISSLQTLQITDAPVFAVAQNGNEATILMGWRDTTEDLSVVFREDTKYYDMAQPIEAFMFEIAVHRILYHYQEKIADKLSPSFLREFLSLGLNRN